MKVFKPDSSDAADYQKDLTEYPGFLGYERGEDGLFTDCEEMKPLNTVNWPNLFEKVDELGADAELNVVVNGSQLIVKIAPMRFEIAQILDQIPAIDVQIDKEWLAYIFFLQDGFTLRDVEEQVAGLVKGISKLMAG